MENKRTYKHVVFAILSVFTLYIVLDLFNIPQKFNIPISNINTDLFGRIMNNIISNIEKYASRNNPIQVQILYEENYTGILIRNTVAQTEQTAHKTGIGLQNISVMMEHMQGYLEVLQKDRKYCMILHFPYSAIQKHGNDKGLTE